MFAIGRHVLPTLFLATLVVQLFVTPAHSSNRIVQLLSEGKPVFGVFSGDKTREQGRHVAAQEEADFVLYSMTRPPLDFPGMITYMDGMRDLLGWGVPSRLPLALRVPDITDPAATISQVQSALDAGVYSVVFPFVETREQAELGVRAMRYLNEGGRRTGESTRAARYWGVSATRYREVADVWPLNPAGQLLQMVIVESQKGVQNVRAIAQTPGLGVLFAGPGDLRRAYNSNSEAVEAAIQTILSACMEFNVACGITASPEDIEKRLSEGWKVLLVYDPAALSIGRRAAGR